MPKIIEVNDEPPSSLRKSITDRVYSGSHNGSVARRREVALLQHLSSPFIGSRFRNDLVVLASV